MRNPGAIATLCDPFLLDELVLFQVHELVCSADRSVADFDCETNLFRRLGLAHEMGDEIETGTSDGQRRTSSCDSVMSDLIRAFLCNHLYLCSKGKFGAGTGHETRSAGGCGAAFLVEKVDGVDDGTVACDGGPAVLRLLYEGLENLECTADFLLADVGHLEDLAETALLVVLPTRDEDAAGDNSVLRFAFEQFGVVGHLKQHLGCLGGRATDVL